MFTENPIQSVHLIDQSFASGLKHIHEKFGHVCIVHEVFRSWVLRPAFT